MKIAMFVTSFLLIAAMAAFAVDKKQSARPAPTAKDAEALMAMATDARSISADSPLPPGAEYAGSPGPVTREIQQRRFPRRKLFAA